MSGIAGSLVPLAGLLQTNANDPMPDHEHIRVYYSSVTTSTQMRGLQDDSAKTIKYRIQPRNARGFISRARPEVMRIPHAVVTTDEYRRSAASASRRAQALPETYETVDLCGVITRLAKGIAHFSHWGGLTAAELRGGGNVSVQAVGAQVTPVAANVGAVFITMKGEHQWNRNMAAALVNAVSGEGGTAYTDLLGVDAMGVVQVPNAADAELAVACYHALLHIGGIYKQLNQGPLFALMVVKGMNAMTSLWGHTDEGAYPRTVLRQTNEAPPFGGIYVDNERAYGIPDPGRSLAGFRRLTDAVLIAAGGAVALADPMVLKDGKYYPTILTSDADQVMDDPGEDNAGAAGDARDLQPKWADACRGWAPIYSKALGELFAMPGETGRAASALNMMADAASADVDRHMQFRSVVAFCWVEPTTACPIGDDTYRAYYERHGPLALHNRPSDIPVFDGVQVVREASDAMRTMLQVDFRFARRHGILLHTTMHTQDGMGSMQLMSGVASNFGMVGGNANAMAARINGGDTLDSYMWGRADTNLISPGEFIDLNKSTMISVLNIRFEDRVPTGRPTHTCSPIEYVAGDVRVEASRLYGGEPEAVAAGARPGRRQDRRVKTRCLQALALARQENTVGGIFYDGAHRAVLYDPGELSMSVAARPSRPNDGMAAARQGGAGGVTPAAEVLGRQGAGAHGGNVNGPIVPLTIQHSADRGRRAPRVPVGRGGGGAPRNPGGGGGGGAQPGGGPGGGPQGRPGGGGAGGGGNDGGVPVADGGAPVNPGPQLAAA